MNRRILHVIDTGGPGGAETVVLTLAQYWGEPGAEHLVLVGREDWLASELRKKGIPYKVVNAKGRYSLRYLQELRRQIRAFRPDAIISHLLGSNTYCSVAANLADVPLISVFHGPTDVAGGGSATKIKLRIVGMLSSKIVFVSEALKNHVQGLTNFNLEKVEVVHNGTHIPEPGAKNAARTVDKEVANEDRPFIVGCVGNLRPAKNYDMLLRVAKLLKNNQLNVLFRIFGHQRSDIYEALQEAARKLDVTDTVSFMGYADDPDQEFRSFDVFAISSNSEGIPLALLEAMARGVPVVSTCVGGIPEVIVDGQSGFLVDVDDDDAFARALQSVLLDHELREKLAREGLQRISNHFSTESMTQDYRQLVKEVT